MQSGFGYQQLPTWVKMAVPARQLRKSNESRRVTLCEEQLWKGLPMLCCPRLQPIQPKLHCGIWRRFCSRALICHGFRQPGAGLNQSPLWARFGQRATNVIDLCSNPLQHISGGGRKVFSQRQFTFQSQLHGAAMPRQNGKFWIAGKVGRQWCGKCDDEILTGFGLC